MMDYNQTLEDVVRCVRERVSRDFLAQIGVQLDPNIYSTAQMPLADVRPFQVVPELQTTGNYYTAFTVEIELMAVDLSEPRKAGRIVADLVKRIQEALRQRPWFGDWDTVSLGNVDFIDVQDKKAGAISGALMRVTISMYTD